MKALEECCRYLPLFFRYDVIMTCHDVKTEFLGVEIIFLQFWFNFNNSWSYNVRGQYNFKVGTRGRNVEVEGPGHTEHENQRNPFSFWVIFFFRMTSNILDRLCLPLPSANCYLIAIAFYLEGHRSGQSWPSTDHFGILSRSHLTFPIRRHRNEIWHFSAVLKFHHLSKWSPQAALPVSAAIDLPVWAHHDDLWRKNCIFSWIYYFSKFFRKVCWSVCVFVCSFVSMSTSPFYKLFDLLYVGS